MTKKEKSLEESKKKKVPFNVLRKGAIVGLLGLTMGFGCLGLAGCSLSGVDGINGQNGTNIYVGYDGYVWQDGVRTTFKLDQDTEGRENVVEDTIGAYTTMGYWAGEYVDLSTNTIALMANYKPNAKLTQYSGTKVTEIQVVAEGAGTLHIGTAKVANVVAARTNGTELATTTTSHDLVAGVNTITLDLIVAEDETIVLGGSNSTAKVYVVKNLPVSDEQGNFTFIDTTTHTDILAKTGDYADTLAVEVKAKSVMGVTQKIFPSITTQVLDENISGMYAVNTSSGPYRYINTELFSGKTITRFGLPVKTIRDENTVTPYVTIYVVKNSVTSNYISNKVASYKIEFQNAEVNKWAYAECEIPLAEDETIAISASESDSSIQWGCSLSTLDESCKFYNNVAGTGGSAVLTFDFEALKTFNDFQEYLEYLDNLEEKASRFFQVQQLKTVLANQNITNMSILGDSISTYEGYSNDSVNTNSTIGSNAVYYSGDNHGISDVDETWWKQTANMVGMNILVNNSYSGDRVEYDGSKNRSVNLHDDTGDNSGTNPDVIAVYLGINDLLNGVSNDTFRTSYDQMIGKMVNKYSNSKIFLFTLVPNKRVSDMDAYNSIIKDIALKYKDNCVIVDLYENSGITLGNCADYMEDSAAIHPNMSGMDKMADCFWNVLYNKYVTNAD